MKKLFLLCFVLSMFTISISAQEDRFQFGLKIGVEFPIEFGDFDGNEFESITNYPRYSFGVLANIAFSEKIGLQPGLFFQDRTTLFNENDFQTRREISQGYFLVPIMVEYKFLPGLSIQAGPRLGFRAFTSDGEDLEQNDITDANTFEGAFAFGPQYITKFGLFANVRVHYAFTSVYNSSDYSFGGVGVNLGYLF